MSFTPPQPPDLDRPEAVTPPVPLWQPPATATHHQPPIGAASTQQRRTNNHAVWGLILAAGAIGLLFLSSGIAAPVTLPASIAGWVLGVKGKRRVDRGEPVGDRSMAVTAQITGITGVVLGVLALAFWVLLLVLGLSGDFLEDFNGFPDGDPGGRLD